MAWAVFLLVGSFLVLIYSVDAQGTNVTDDTGPRTIIVGAIENPGFLRKREDGSYEGFHMDVLRELSDILNYDFRIKQPADMKYGYPLEDGSWVGMVGELIRGDMDMALGLTVAAKREAVIDFSATVFDERLEMLIKKPDEEIERREWWTLATGIMTIPVMVIVALSFLFTGIVMFIIIRVSPYESRAYSAEVGEANRLSTFGHSLWICVSSMSWQGVDYSPRSLSGRFLFFFWFGFIIWYLILVTGAVTGFLLSGPTAQTVPIQSFNDLAASDEFLPAFLKGGRTEHNFRDSLFATYQRIYEKAILVSSTSEGIQLARSGGVAFITDSATTRIHSNQQPCDLMSIYDGDSFTARPQAVGLQADSPLRQPLNDAILQLTESGRLHALFKKWIDSGECPRIKQFAHARASSFHPITHRDMMPVFVELVVGAILALCIMGIEVKLDQRKSNYSKSPQKSDAAPPGNSAGQHDDDTKV